MAVFVFFRLLPLDAASALGGWIGRNFGPLLGVHHTARRNIARAFPEKSEEEREEILRGMWDNLGRVGAEYPHMARPAIRRRVTLKGAEHLEQVRTSDRSYLFFSGHFGNWEMLPRTAADHGVPLFLIYRHANNPFADWLIRRIRGVYNRGMSRKGSDGALQVLRAIRERRHIGMLIDQKMNDGIPVPFFGRDAMTAPAIAQLALKYELPLLPACVTRTHGAHFTITAHPPYYLENTGNRQEDIRIAMTAINARFEEWVRAHPSQWFWVHNRWPKE